MMVVDKIREDMPKVVDKLEDKQSFEEEDMGLVDMQLNEAGRKGMEMVFDKPLLVDKKLNVVEARST